MFRLDFEKIQRCDLLRLMILEQPRVFVQNGIMVAWLAPLSLSVRLCTRNVPSVAWH